MSIGQEDGITKIMHSEEPNTAEYFDFEAEEKEPGQIILRSCFKGQRAI